MTENEVKIRPIAIAVIKRDGKLFVFEGHDTVKDEIFYRPLGGGIEFGERGEDAVRREFTEEIGAELINVSYISTMENIFIHQGRPHHEIVMLYQADIGDESFYEDRQYMGNEDDGSDMKCLWLPINKFSDGKLILYPAGLIDTLKAL